MLLGKFGRGICERFLFPYNEKLYACNLDKLSADAMGRFFPYADLREIIYNFKYPLNKSYNANFIYPKRGIFELVKAINKSKSRIFKSKACLEYLELYKKQHYPGLGYVKKLSMQHHIELIAAFIKRENQYVLLP